jgi:hypothetical protein
MKIVNIARTALFVCVSATTGVALWIALVVGLSTLIPETLRLVARILGEVYAGHSYDDTRSDSMVLGGLLGFPLIFVFAFLMFKKFSSATWSKRAALCGIVLVAFLAGTRLHRQSIPLITDAELTRRFAVSRNNLETVRQMVNEDDLNGVRGRIGLAYGPTHIAAERLAEYRRLLSSVGYGRLWPQGRDKPFEITVDSTGFLDVGDYKGYYYSPEKEKTPTAPSLDHSCFEIPNASSKDGKYCHAYRSLGGGWWLLRYEYRD